MFEKLLTLLLHGKSAVLAGALVAGTTGILVTGTIGGQNVNLTLQPSNHTTVNAPAASPSLQTLLTTLQNLVGRPQEQAGTTTTGPGCDQAAHDRNVALRAAARIAFEARADLRLLAEDSRDKHLKSSEVKPILDTARKAIEDARKDAFTSIRNEFKTVACVRNDDEDKNEQADKDKNEDKAEADEDKNEPAEVDEDKDESVTVTTGTAQTTSHDNDKDKDNDSDKSEKSHKSNGGTAALTAAPQVTFDTTKVDAKYAAFVKTELDAVNSALSTAFQGLSALTPSTSNTEKSDKSDKKDAQKHEKKSHDHGHEDKD